MKIKNISRNCWARLLLLGGIMVSADTCAEVVVVVSAKNHIASLSAEQTAKIFLGKVDNFPNGGNAMPIDQPEGSAIRDEFYSKVAHKAPIQISAYWAKIIFTGDGVPPQALESNAAVKQAVANNPNAIGYIDRSAVDGTVRIILAP